MTTDESPLAIVAEFGGILDRLQLRYIVGGSFASSLYGIPRATQDADFVVALNASVVARLVDALGADYDADA